MTLSMRWILPSLLAACSLLAPVQARAERTAWNQEQVAAIASDLAMAIEKVKSSVEADPEQASVLQERRRQGALVDLRRLGRLSADLAAKLKAGQGLQETESIYDEIQAVRRQARDAGRDVLNPESTVRDVAAARRMLERLAPYYESR